MTSITNNTNNGISNNNHPVTKPDSSVDSTPTTTTSTTETTNDTSSTTTPSFASLLPAPGEDSIDTEFDVDTYLRLEANTFNQDKEGNGYFEYV